MTSGTQGQIHGAEDGHWLATRSLQLRATSGAPRDLDIPSNENSNDDRLLRRFLCSITTLFAHFVASCTHNEVLRAATSDSNVEQITEKLKSEWTKVGRWLLALAALNVSLLTIDAQTLFQVDKVAQDLIALSAVATGLGMLCDAWFLGWNFMDRARDTYGSYTYFSLSSELPLVAVFVSLMFLMAFGARILYNALPAPVLLVGSACFGIIMALRFVVQRDPGVGNESGLQV
ncbi:hypothetical protein GGX14DRAFT_389272 [Mycena pura]|uniref:Transmembrane protein n=1 Tax=Mycena pura TaxID=153505 RepID=A0AAD6YK37_9AGAR|nr:hypothetical protein GGX14DRAFT_389272 [Mycena pura]